MHNQSPRPERCNCLAIGFTGRIGAGKTSAARYVQEAYGFQYVRYSQVLSEWHDTEPAPKVTLQQFGWEVMSGGMQVELNKRLIGRIDPDHDCAVDGLRHPIDYKSLYEQFKDNFYLVFIETDVKTRWEHVKGRQRYSSFESFRLADDHAVEQHIEELRPLEQFVICNEGSLSELYAKSDEMLQQVTAGGRK